MARLFLFLFERNYCNAGSSKLYMFVAIGRNALHRIEIFTDSLSQDSISCPVQNPHLLDVELQSIVDEIRYCLQGFVGAHASDIELLLEMQLSVSNGIGSRC